jgi:hypothetical protein
MFQGKKFALTRARARPLSGLRRPIEAESSLPLLGNNAVVRFRHGRFLLGSTEAGPLESCGVEEGLLLPHGNFEAVANPDDWSDVDALRRGPIMGDPMPEKPNYSWKESAWLNV